MQTTTNFASDGFDLDAAVNDSDVLEIGGGVAKLNVNVQEGTGDQQQQQATTGTDETTAADTAAAIPDPMKVAEDFKAKGNACFQKNKMEDAIDYYTSAIKSTPGHPTGVELLDLQEAFNEEQDRLWRQKLAQLEQERREEAAKKRRDDLEKKKERASSNNANDGAGSAAKDNNLQPDRPKKEEFQPPKHVHGDKLAVYHCNRAAAYLHLQQCDKALVDCNIALLLNPNYVKALVRRATAYEKLEKTDLALADVIAALQLDPTNRELRQRRDKLQKLEDERLEKLKTETMDKLKDLGNSILGNFGLSLDNFKAVQDPNTGSYSINFQQGKS